MKNQSGPIPHIALTEERRWAIEKAIWALNELGDHPLDMEAKAVLEDMLRPR